MIARRLTRFCFGPVSSMKTMREVEIALFERQLFPNLVRDDVTNAPPVRRRRGELLTGHLLVEHHVPEAEFGPHASILDLRHPPDDERLRAGAAPVGEPRGRIEVADPFDKTLWVERLEEAGAFEVGRDDAGDVGREAWILAKERRNGDWSWPDIRLVDVDLERAALRLLRRDGENR